MLVQDLLNRLDKRNICPLWVGPDARLNASVRHLRAVVQKDGHEIKLKRRIGVAHQFRGGLTTLKGRFIGSSLESMPSILIERFSLNDNGTGTCCPNLFYVGVSGNGLTKLRLKHVSIDVFMWDFLLVKDQGIRLDTFDKGGPLAPGVLGVLFLGDSLFLRLRGHTLLHCQLDDLRLREERQFFLELFDCLFENPFLEVRLLLFFLFLFYFKP
jgi:hypothetical protein